MAWLICRCGSVRHIGGLNPALLHRQPGSSVHPMHFSRLLGFRMSLRGGVARTVLTSSDSSDERNPPGANSEIHSQPTIEDLCTQTQCPILPGTYNQSSSSDFPDISGKITIKIEWFDKAATSLLCAQISTKVA